MNGYLRVAAISPKVYVGAIKKNVEAIKNVLSVLCAEGVKVVVSPRLALTSLSLGDVFLDVIKGTEDLISLSSGLHITARFFLFSFSFVVRLGIVFW